MSNVRVCVCVCVCAFFVGLTFSFGSQKSFGGEGANWCHVASSHAQSCAEIKLQVGTAPGLVCDEVFWRSLVR